MQKIVSAGSPALPQYPLQLKRLGMVPNQSQKLSLLFSGNAIKENVRHLEVNHTTKRLSSATKRSSSY